MQIKVSQLESLVYIIQSNNIDNWASVANINVMPAMKSN